MYKIPSKVSTRISNAIKMFIPIIELAKSRDVNESDTVIIVTDVLAQLFGYDKYSEITSEYAIRGTYCDLATKIDSKPNILIEVKAIGLELKESHVKQVVDYASNLGVDWVILTNATRWIIYKVNFSKPINQELVIEFEFLSLNNKRQKDIDLLYPISKEGYLASSLQEFHTQKQTLNKFFIGALIQHPVMLQYLRKELKKISPGLYVEDDELRDILRFEVVKREIIDSEEVVEALKKINRYAAKIQRDKKNSKPVESDNSNDQIEDSNESKEEQVKN